MIKSYISKSYPINFPTSFKGYHFLECLESGSTCILCLIENETTKEKFAAKIISKENVLRNKSYKSIINLANILKSLSHPHIIQIIESFEIENDEHEKLIVIIMEYCENGNLKSYLKQHYYYVSDSTKKQITFDFLSAIKYLHDKRISHGDIKLENILLDSHLSAKLCDFGYCKTQIIAGDESKSGTLCYAAPELLKNDTEFNTLKADIYSIGITMYAIFELHFPFTGSGKATIINQIKNGNLSFEKGIDNQLLYLVKQCTNIDPSQRPDADEILTNDFFSGTNNSTFISNDLITNEIHE